MENGPNNLQATQAFAISLELPENKPPHQERQRESHAGDLCPNCRGASLDYDGLLNLVCAQCGYTLAGCFT